MGFENFKLWLKNILDISGFLTFDPCLMFYSYLVKILYKKITLGVRVARFLEFTYVIL